MNTTTTIPNPYSTSAAESARAVLNSSTKELKEMGFRTIVKNRTVHGGIIASGSGFLKHGENGKGVLSRWYPETLARRIRDIGSVSSSISFFNGDAFEVLKNYGGRKSVAWFLDPPYSAAGKKAGTRLYTHWQIDHERLFSMAERLKGPLLMTYDESNEIREMAKRHGFKVKSVAMNNTHHSDMTELIISKELSWH